MPMPYPETTEKFMRKFFNTLSEKDKRRYAAIEAQKLKYGGISYIARVLGCSRTTIHQGLSELEALPADSRLEARIRRAGGGRKSYEQTTEGIDEAFLDVLKDNIAGDPMDERVRWTNLTQDEIRERMMERHHIQVSTTVVRQLLTRHHFRRRKAQKNEP
jgi:hypothetical protein